MIPSPGPAPHSSVPPPGRRHSLKQSMADIGLSADWSILQSLSSLDFGHAMISTGNENEHVLVFQGDSITDTGRLRKDPAPNHPPSLGSGYVALAVAELMGSRPGSEWVCYNRGIGGNTVNDLGARWEEDCLALEPDVLSILVGVNDYWHTLSGEHQGTVKEFEQTYRRLLQETRDALPDVTLLVGEPFALSGGTAVDDRWTPAFDRYRAAAAQVADAADATWIPYQSVLDEALEMAPVDYWAPDGIHPTPAGHYRMAQAWIEAFRRAIDR